MYVPIRFIDTNLEVGVNNGGVFKQSVSVLFISAEILTKIDRFLLWFASQYFDKHIQIRLGQF